MTVDFTQRSMLNLYTFSLISSTLDVPFMILNLNILISGSEIYTHLEIPLIQEKLKLSSFII